MFGKKRIAELESEVKHLRTLESINRQLIIERDTVADNYRNLVDNRFGLIINQVGLIMEYSNSDILDIMAIRAKYHEGSHISAILTISTCTCGLCQVRGNSVLQSFDGTPICEECLKIIRDSKEE
jgi:hypothetical protein